MTRLQLILILLVFGGLGGGAFWLQKEHPGVLTSLWDTYNPMKTTRPTPPAAEQSPETSPASKSSVSELKNSRAAVARYLADVGELYRQLSVSGDIPTISEPLRAAKAAFAAGRYDEARTAAEKAHAACKQLKKEAAAQFYQVVKGDTLWTIAERKSPVRQGAGWVGLWKANKRLVKNFDRIEVGWTLNIPQKVSQYATVFWKPRMIAAAPRPNVESQLVDLRELPIQNEEEVDLAELPMVREASAFEASALRTPTLRFLPPVQYH